MSFLIDPPLLIAAGAAIERIAPSEDVADVLEVATVATFIGGSVGLYLNAEPTRWLWELCGAESGRDWMLNSGVFDLEHHNPPDRTHAAAAALFATYPLWPRLGRWLARRSSARSRASMAAENV